ncbi:MAG: hypothetical protein GWM93_18155, partial [Gemmatimonadetes bacterium]|nr:hypothetical protein [Gemmatimonadota bacterium]NIY37157.1 hypothetical protein [Gemmatimonadota bacterium]
MFWTVRSETDPTGLVPAVRREVAELDPAIPVADVRLMSGYVREAQAATRFALMLIGV